MTGRVLPPPPRPMLHRLIAASLNCHTCGSSTSNSCGVCSSCPCPRRCENVRGHVAPSRPKRATRNPNPDYKGKGGVRLKHLIDGYGSSLCEVCNGKGCKSANEDTPCLAYNTKKGEKRKR